MAWSDSPVGVIAGLLLGGDDGLQVLLSTLLAVVLAVGRGGASDFLGLFDSGLLDAVGAIHGAATGVLRRVSVLRACSRQSAGFGGADGDYRAW